MIILSCRTLLLTVHSAGASMALVVTPPFLISYINIREESLGSLSFGQYPGDKTLVTGSHLDYIMCHLRELPTKLGKVFLGGGVKFSK